MLTIRTGRWRTQWVVDKSKALVEGTINVDVHYYEQGNVQLATRHSASFPCPVEPVGGQSIASQIVTTISKIETAYHMELNDVYGELGDKAFRALVPCMDVRGPMTDAQTQASLAYHSPEDGLGEGFWLFTRGRLDEITSMILVVRFSEICICHVSRSASGTTPVHSAAVAIAKPAADRREYAVIQHMK